MQQIQKCGWGLVALLVVVAGAVRAEEPVQRIGDTQLFCDKLSIIADGMVLEGSASVKSPDFAIAANRIKVTLGKGGITFVEGTGTVSIKARVGKTAEIEANSDKAVLNKAQRTLEMSGHAHGWVEMQGRGRNRVSGNTVILRREGDKDIFVKVFGQVHVEISPEDFGRPLAIGKVVITAREATFSNQTGPARFVGDAKASSTDGPHKFDVTANEFTLNRAASGAVESLKTVGRTQIKLDLPPEAAPKAGAESFQRPSHVEVAADSITVTAADKSVILDGNVKGMYRVPTGDMAGDYPFSGQHLTARYVTAEEATADLPKGINLVWTGKPVQMTFPGFNLQ